MDADGQLSHTQSIVAKSAQVQNIAGAYNDHSTTNIKNIHVSNFGLHEMDLLLKHVAHGAVHDSAERGPDAPKCHPETRTAVQKEITSWIMHGDQDDAPKRVLWLSGPAGSGKTAIAGTIADECFKQGLLAASFFFSAFADSKLRRLKKSLIPTIIYSLLQHECIVGFKEEVLAVMNRDPMVFERRLDQQVESLVLVPLRRIADRSNRRGWPSVIVVDGLDECQGNSESDIGPEGDILASGSNAQREILSTLARACADPAFPFLIIMASRPEPVIRHFFSTSPTPVLNIFLDNRYDPDADIRLFLGAAFSDIRRRSNLPSSWAPTDVIDLLVEEASGQFIYAATVLRFIDNPRLGAPHRKLSRLLEWRHLDNAQPFAPLDALYSRILHTSPEPLLAAKWLRLIDRQNALSEVDSLYLKNVLESYSGESEYVLGSLTSLIGLVDERNGGPNFHFYHKSLLDFLRDPRRSADLHINMESFTHFVWDRYYQVLQARGSQSNADSSTKPPSQNFRATFCRFLDFYIDPYRRYSSGDVEWWLANLHGSDRLTHIPWMFVAIHRECKWYHSCPGCGVWRKGILRHCRERGWRVPTKVEMLQDRFKKFKFDDRSPLEYPLRAPVIESGSSVISAGPRKTDSASP